MKNNSLPAILTADSPLKFNTKNEHLVFEERVWGLKKLEIFVFDPENYAAADFLKEDKEEMILSDTVIRYYSSGRREIVPKNPAIIHLNQYKGYLFSKKSDVRKGNYWWANMEQMLTMFPNDAYLKALDKKYPYLRQNGRFYIHEDKDSFDLAMNLAQAVSYEGSLSYVKEKFSLSSLGNLRKFFAICAKVLQDSIDGNSTEQTEKIDAWMTEHGIYAEIKNEWGKVISALPRLYAGYTDLPYHLAEAILLKKNKSVIPLREQYLKSGEPMALSAGMQIFSQKSCNDYSLYDEQLGCPKYGTFLFDPSVIKSWGSNFTPAELSIINRERYFQYYNPDCSDKQRTKPSIIDKVKNYFSCY